jgi:predicted Ser/Thr protein kinase
MPYPQIIDYNEAVQNPAQSFLDRELKTGSIRVNSLGLPIVLSGGFALTYTVSTAGKQYAVRCFHREIPAIELKYREISKKLRVLNGNYFVGFEFQSDGILVKGHWFPIVRMDWIDGDTLGVWLDKNYRNSAALLRARDEFRKLALYLDRQGIAHGDIQNGNVMMSERGIKLIDYDGMFVPGIPLAESSEYGHKHFQHPQRAPSNYGRLMDRFSFIVLDLSLDAVIGDSTLYTKFREGGETIIFKANDFADPKSSEVMSVLSATPSLRERARWLAAICEADIGAVPSLDDYIAGRNIPRAAPTNGSDRVSPERPSVRKYIAAYHVVDARDYSGARKRVGDRVELIGKIVELRHGTGKYGRGKSRKYVFINFGFWRGNIVKLSIWSEGLARLTQKPTDAWVGRWVSVTGLIDPPYHNVRWGYTHLSISVQENGQIQFLDEAQALFRLDKGPAVQRKPGGQVDSGGSGHPGSGEAARSGNSAGAGKPVGSGQADPTGAPGTRSKNQEILRRFTQFGASPSSAPVNPGAQVPPAPQPQTPGQNQSRSSIPASSVANSSGPGHANALFSFVRRVPLWVWVVVGLGLLYVVGQHNEMRLGNPRPPNYSTEPPPNRAVPSIRPSQGSLAPTAPDRNNVSDRSTAAKSPATLPESTEPADRTVSSQPTTQEHVVPDSNRDSTSPSGGRMPPLPDPAPVDLSPTRQAAPAGGPPPASSPEVETASKQNATDVASGVQDNRASEIDLQRREDAKRVQARLVELGFLTGPADGVWGARWSGALTKFRIANRLGRDGHWDDVTAAKLFSDSAAHANKAEAVNFVGGWAASVNDCRAGMDGRAPLNVTAKRAETSTGACQFGLVQRDLEGWNVRALCTVGEKSWIANIKLMLKGNTLTWTSERGTDTYVRCSGP